ncbi:hypothetical protein [Nocardia panacis]|uniref:hypothetical protein n=1 Tax=Nocardia panacis TaxID=2340916 RepID=UPI0011C405BA|nr:hypothetical protein [Nocardia panacis]
MRRRVRRRPAGRSVWEVRAPGHVRPTVHPNPAGGHEKPWGGVMCVPSEPGADRRTLGPAREDRS